MISEKNGTKIVTEDLSTLGGDMMARLRPDVEFRVEDDKNGKVILLQSLLVPKPWPSLQSKIQRQRINGEFQVTRFLAHRKVVGALLGPADTTEKVVKVKDVAGEAFGALLTFLYQPASVTFDLSVISISSLLQLFLLAHR